MLLGANAPLRSGQVAEMLKKSGLAITGKTSLHAFKIGYKLTREMIPPLGLLLLASAMMVMGIGTRRMILRRGFERHRRYPPPDLPRRRWRDRLWWVGWRRPVPQEHHNA